MHGSRKKFVYIIRNDRDPSRRYTGVTNDLASRLEPHDFGRYRTVASNPWSLVVSLEFPDEQQARRFETYLKSGSGRAFAKRHFGSDISSSEEGQ
jgi:predicted GIY-YIG superfamily endonuclease